MKLRYPSYFLFSFLLIVTAAKAQDNIKPLWLVNPVAAINGGTISIRDIDRAKDGSVYTVGNFTNTADLDMGKDTFNLTAILGSDMFVAKYDKRKKLVFAFALGSISSYENISSVTSDKDGNFYITGVYSEATDFDPGAGKTILSTSGIYDSDIFFAKYTSTGNLVFVKTLKGPNNEDYPRDMAVDKNGNIFIAGNFSGTKTDFDPGSGVVNLPGNNKSDIFFAKYDANGNYLFVKNISGESYESAVAMALDKNSNILITGSFQTFQLDFDPGPDTATLQLTGGTNIYFAKYDSSGNYIYAHNIGGTGGDNEGFDITTDKAGNAIVTGQMSGSNVDFDPGAGTALRTSKGTSDIFIAKYTINGSFLFANVMGSAKSDKSNVVQTDSNDDIYITGSFSESVDFDPGTAIHNLSSVGKNDIFFAKYDAAGNYIYANAIGGADDDFPVDLLVNNSEIFLTATFKGTIDINPGNIEENLFAQSINSFINNYDATGNLTSFGTIGNYRSFGLFSNVITMAHDSLGNSYIMGRFEGSIDFDPGVGTYYLTSASDINSTILSGYRGDIYFAKYSSVGKLIFAKNISGKMGEQANGIAVDDAGSIYLCGVFEDSCDFDPGPGTAYLTDIPDSDDQSYFFAKYDADGNYVFAKKLELADKNGYGESLTGIAIDKDRNIYLSGFFNYGDFDPGPAKVNLSSTGKRDIFFARYDASGNFVYAKNIGQAGSFTQNCNDIKNSPEGTLVICGQMNGNAVDFDPNAGTYLLNTGISQYAHFVAGYTLTGQFLFAANSTTSTNSYSNAKRIAFDDENIYVIGSFNGKLDFDPGPDSTIVKGSYNYNNFVAKYDAGGAFLFCNGFIQEGGDSYNGFGFLFNGIATDKNHNFYITGQLDGKVDFDPGPNANYLRDSSNLNSVFDIFLAKYDSLGRYRFANSFYSIDTSLNRSHWGQDVWTDQRNNILLTGVATGTIDFDPGTDTLFFHPTYSNGSYFLVKYEQSNDCNTATPDSLFASIVKTTTAKLNWNYAFNPTSFEILYRAKGDSTWIQQTASGIERFKNIGNLYANTKYQWKIRAVCSGANSGYSAVATFKTDAAVLTNPAISALQSRENNYGIQITPNPVAGSHFQIKMNNVVTNAKNLQVEMYNSSGQKILSRQVNMQQTTTVPLPSNILAGIYFVTVRVGNVTAKQVLIRQ